jgi:hypothetical protein
VKWSIVRDDAPQDHRGDGRRAPDMRPRMDLGDLKVKLERLENMTDEDEMRRELQALNQQLRQIQRLTRVSVDVQSYRALTEAQQAGRLRYAGRVGGSEVEVRGTGTVVVTPSENGDAMVINTGESVVIIRTPREGKGSKAPKN